MVIFFFYIVSWLRIDIVDYNYNNPLPNKSQSVLQTDTTNIFGGGFSRSPSTCSIDLKQFFH